MRERRWWNDWIRICLRGGSFASALLLVCLLVLPAQADDRGDAKAKPTDEEVAGGEVLRAIEADDTEALTKLASRSKPDPWMIADWLLSQGEADAADAFAGVVQGPATRKLAAYVRSMRRHEDPEGARDALAKAVAEIEASRYAAAYPLLEPFPATETTVLSVQIHFARGMGLYILRKRDAAMRALGAARERAHKIGWLTQESIVLEWLAQTATEKGDLMIATAHARARVAIERGLDGRPKQYARALTRLAQALKASGDYDAALEVAVQGMGVQREAKDALGVAWMSLLVASVAQAAEDYDTAIRHAREGLEIFEREDDAPGIAESLLVVGTIYEDMDEYVDARLFLERAVRLTEEGGQAVQHARALALLGGAYTRLGEYPKALTCYETALAYHRSRNDSRSVAFNLNNLAVLYDQIGDRQRAGKLLEETLAIFEKMDDQVAIASVCLNLGMLAMFKRDYDAAAALLDRSVRIRRQSTNTREIASVTSALGNLAAARGNHAEAVTFQREALRLYGKTHDRGNLPSVLVSLGRALVRTGDAEEAVAVLDRAILEASALRSPRTEVFVLAAMAAVQLELGNAERALEVSQTALRGVEHLLGGLAEEEGARARAEHATVFEVGALAALRAKRPKLVLKFLEAGRAGSLLESLGGRDALRYTDVSDALAKQEAEARVAEAKAAARYRRAARTGDRGVQKAAAKTLTQATERMRDVVAKIQREAKARAGLVYPRPASLSEIHRRLAPDQALVVYGFCLEELLAVVVTPKNVHALSQGSSARVRTACDAWGRFDAGTDVAPLVADLRSQLVEALELDTTVKQVLVSPSGPLCYIPFGVLFEQRVAMTPSGTTHALLRRERYRPGQDVLALGDPAYGDVAAGPGQFYTRGGPLTRLPATRIEVEQVGDVVLLGEQASEGGFREGVAKRPRWRSVHLACHGRVDRERPTLCALALTPSEEDDGFLTALEVLRMNIPADLVVLSACETGAGRVVRGEGIVGLTRAFMYAGSPRVLCSLWKVDDAATQALMTRFYELWNPKQGKGVGAALALKQAQAFVKGHEKWKHPYYWAAWVLWGLPD